VLLAGLSGVLLNALLVPARPAVTAAADARVRDIRQPPVEERAAA
jgi:hypothetical protein